MSLISSDTLFHFTPSRESLIGILEHEFKPRLSLENFALVAQRLPPSGHMLECAIPMVCFCDIPLSQTGVHMEHYGRYGIGLKKTWGIGRRVAPVTYVHENAPGPQGIADLVTHIGQLTKSSSEESLTHSALKPGILVYYMKPYEGRLERVGKKVRFYDEREWRYVPAEVEAFPPISREELNDPIRRGRFEGALGALSRLSFDPWDINYIIVESESEVLETYRAIDTIKRKYNDDDRSLLKTRILSAERIKADF